MTFEEQKKLQIISSNILYKIYKCYTGYEISWSLFPKNKTTECEICKRSFKAVDFIHVVDVSFLVSSMPICSESCLTAFAITYS